MTHALLVTKAVEWLRSYRCGVVLSEQACVTARCRMRLAGSAHPTRSWLNARFRGRTFSPTGPNHSARNQKSVSAASASIWCPATWCGLREVSGGWGLLEYYNRRVQVLRPSRKNLRSDEGFRCEMNLLLASLRRVEIHISPKP